MSISPEKSPALFETEKKKRGNTAKKHMLNDLSSWENHPLVLWRIEFDRV